MDRLLTDRVVFAATLFLAAVYFYATESLPTMRVGDPLGPKAFPRLLFAGLLVAAVLIFLEMRRNGRGVMVNATDGEPKDPPAWGLLAGIVACTGLYFVAFEPAGYVVATTVYLVALTSFFNPGKWVANLASSIVFAAGSYLAFEFLGVALPQGLLAI